MQGLGSVLLQQLLVPTPHLAGGETKAQERRRGLLWDSVNSTFYSLSGLCFGCGSRNSRHTELLETIRDHCASGETEAQRGKGTYPRSHCWLAGWLGW